MFIKFRKQHFVQSVACILIFREITDHHYDLQAPPEHRTKNDMAPKTPEGELGLALLTKTVEIGWRLIAWE